MKKTPRPDWVFIILKQFIQGLILLLPAIAGAQRITPAPEDLYLDACEFMLAGDYQEALPLLMGLQGRGIESAGLDYRIGECYLNLQGQRRKALSYLQKAANHISPSWTGNSLTENLAPPKAWLYLGISFRLNERFDEAEQAFRNYVQALEPSDSTNRALANSHIARCRNARVLQAAPGVIQIDTLPESVNNGLSNFNPVPAPGDHVYYMNRLKFYDALMESRFTDGAWQKAENLTPGVGSDGDHILTGISADGNALLFSYNDPMTGGDIYLTEYGNGKWSTLRKLDPPVNSRFNESHASFASDGSLYFTSDRKGGYGGLDIYHATKDPKGIWNNPENLGSAINTPLNEESPFLTAGMERLFFSSQGHYNMGGYDVFRAETDTAGGWLPPVNLGVPFNTVDDELFFFPTAKGETGYTYRYPKESSLSNLVSIRLVSQGNPARFIVRGVVSVPDQDTTGLHVRFTRESDQSLVARIPLRDGHFSQALSAGDFKVTFVRSDSLLLEKTLRIPDYFPQNDLILLANIPQIERPLSDTIRLADIRFDFDRSGLPVRYNALLDEVSAAMAKFPALQVTVSGYADSQGNEAYNLRLSRARAEAVAAYLNRTPGIASRVTIHAFGEMNAVARNQTDDGKDLSEGRKYNRRVELQLLPVTPGLVIEREQDIPGSLRARQVIL